MLCSCSCVEYVSGLMNLRQIYTVSAESSALSDHREYRSTVSGNVFFFFNNWQPIGGLNIPFSRSSPSVRCYFLHTICVFYIDYFCSVTGITEKLSYVSQYITELEF